MRKFFSMMLTSALVLGLTACGSSGEPSGGAESQPNEGSQESQPNEGSQESQSSEGNQGNQEAPADATTLSVMIYERGNTTETYGSATDNYWTRWIQQEFGDPNNITLTFVPVPRSEDAQKVNTMMASDSAPDIIFSYDSNMIMQFGKDGRSEERRVGKEC